MYEHLKQVEKNIGQKIIKLKPKISFDILIKKYGWAGFNYRWCTSEKTKLLKQWFRANTTKKDFIIDVVGFACDELKRTEKQSAINKKQCLYPLISDYCISTNPNNIKTIFKSDPEMGMTEAEALEYCYNLGYDWGGLYNYMDRVSCYCCFQQRKKELEAVRYYFPELWEKMLVMEESIEKRPGKYISFRDNKTVADIENEFKEKDKQFNFSFQSSFINHKKINHHLKKKEIADSIILRNSQPDIFTDNQLNFF
jgi:predicted transport protein